MTAKRIFVTGASGCVGHYIVDALIHQTDYELFLLIRDPKKLKFNYNARPGITLIEGDLREIEKVGRLLKTVNGAVLAATAWGGKETYETNVTKTIRVMNLLDPLICEQVLYFSTASILDRHNQPLQAAGEIGTDYIKSKYYCHQELSQLAIAPQITTLFPTLVFGGNEQKPYSHLSAGIQDVIKWMNLIRFFKADGSFHFIHAQDIAKVVLHLIKHPPEPAQPRQLILGNPGLTVNQAIEAVCAYLHKPIYFRIPLSLQLANVLIPLFRIQMADWDRFCLTYRHFTYQNSVNPVNFGLIPHCATVAELLKVSGIPPHPLGKL